MKPLERTATSRELNLDLIRAAAAVLVLAVHFFLNTGFYNFPLQGGGMFLSAVLRMACMTCVPLFMLLTGYLCTKHQWSWWYYRRLLPVLLTYLFAAVACLGFRVFALDEEISLLGMLCRILDFSAAPYAWYVEMYIGLFLLIPFLNAAWNNLGRNAKIALLLSLVVMTSLPAVTNLFRQILPSWWSDIYPLTYYIVGAWLCENPMKLKRRWLLAGWIVLSFAVAGMRFTMDYGEVFSWAAISDWGSLFVLGETVCLFSLVLQYKGERCSQTVRWCINRTARLALPIYLISYITDQIIYPPLCAAFSTMASRLLFMPLMVVLSLLISGAMAQIIEWVVGAIMQFVPTEKKTNV